MNNIRKYVAENVRWATARTGETRQGKSLSITVVEYITLLEAVSDAEKYFNWINEATKTAGPMVLKKTIASKEWMEKYNTKFMELMG